MRIIIDADAMIVSDVIRECLKQATPSALLTRIAKGVSEAGDVATVDDVIFLRDFERAIMALREEWKAREDRYYAAVDESFTPGH